jgi:hypothetical protein
MYLKVAKNPLIIVAAAAAVATAGGIYQLLTHSEVEPLLLVRTIAFLLFLGLYCLKSRFAWHAIALIALAITPAYALLRVPQKSVLESTWIVVALSLLCLVYLWRVRRPYFRFVQDARETKNKRLSI